MYLHWPVFPWYFILFSAFLQLRHWTANSMSFQNLQSTYKLLQNFTYSWGLSCDPGCWINPFLLHNIYITVLLWWGIIRQMRWYKTFMYILTLDTLPTVHNSRRICGKPLLVFYFTVIEDPRNNKNQPR